VGIVGGTLIHLMNLFECLHITWIRLLFFYALCLVCVNNITTKSIADVSSTNGTCPAFDVGYYEPTEIPWVYKSFVLIDTNQTAPKLQTADKNATCNPFPSLSSQLTQLPQSTWTTCEVPPLANNPDAVCAFVYTQPVTNLSTCINRSYQLQTFSSAAAATSAGAVVTHTRGKMIYIKYIFGFLYFRFLVTYTSFSLFINKKPVESVVQLKI